MNSNIAIYISPADPNRQVFLNLDSAHPHILRQPDKTELLRFCRDFESRMIEAFWNNAVIAESPYKAGMPYGLSCSSAGHAVVPSTQVARLLGIKVKLNQSLSARIHAFGFEAVKSALQKLKPKTINEAQKTFTESGRMRFPSFSLIDRAMEHESFATLVESIVSTALSTSLNKRFAAFCLIAMRAEGWILLPTAMVQRVGQLIRGINSMENAWVPTPMNFLNSEQKQVFEQLQGAGSFAPGMEATNSEVKARFTMLCSSLETVKDLTWKFAERILFSTKKESQKGNNTVVTAKIRAHWRNLCQANGQAAMVGAFRQDYRECIKLRCPDDPRLDTWLDILAAECETQTAGNFEPRFQAYGHWLTWLASLPVIPSPLQVTRAHINDLQNPQANTFRLYLQNLTLEKVKNRNKPLTRIADYFDKLAVSQALEGKTFHNPINRKTDAFKNPPREVQQGTKRKRLAGWVLEELKKSIICQNLKRIGGQYKWADSLYKIGVLWIEVAGFADKIFCPIMPAIIYLMLEYPLRSHQVRWLDSGELDPTIYDFDANAFIKNVLYDGERQAYGLLKAASGSPIESELPVDFQVAVNKVLLGERKESNFTIPYVTPQTLWVIRQVLEWQAKYGVSPKRVKEVFEPTRQKNRNQNQKDFYPDICALFRYPLQQSYFPPSLSQVNYFWGDFCEQWDRSNENWTDPSTGKITKRPGVPILSKPYRDYWSVATHDLHSLRVAGVSFLLDAGIPLAVVASIAGHRSLAMTLHYYRADLGELRLKLKDAYAKMGDKKTWERLNAKLNQDYQSYESWLKATPDGYKALREARDSKIWNISLSGICPGTSCDDGLPPEFARPCGSDVPGSRCALCRFFVSGPPFLPGLVQEFNCVLFDLEQKAHRQKQLRDNIEEAGDKNRRGQLEMLRGEMERLENECHLDLKVLAQLHTLINECLDMLNNQAKGPEDNPFALVCTQPEEMRARVNYVGHFARLKELVDAAESLPTSRQTAPDQALLQLKDKILGCLYNNGASCFLAGLPPTLSKRLTIQLADIIEKFIPDEDQREKLIGGQILLKQLPAAEGPILQAIATLENQTSRKLSTGAPSIQTI